MPTARGLVKEHLIWKATGAEFEHVLQMGKPEKIRVVNLANGYVAEWSAAIHNDGEALVFPPAAALTKATANGFEHVSGGSETGAGFKMGVLPNINVAGNELEFEFEGHI